MADWVSKNDAVVRSLPIYVGGASLLAVLLNRAVSGIAPVADASRLASKTPSHIVSFSCISVAKKQSLESFMFKCSLHLASFLVFKVIITYSLEKKRVKYSSLLSFFLEVELNNYC